MIIIISKVENMVKAKSMTMNGTNISGEERIKALMWKGL